MRPGARERANWLVRLTLSMRSGFDQETLPQWLRWKSKGDDSIILDINCRSPHEGINTCVCPHTCKSIHIHACIPHIYIHENGNERKINPCLPIMKEAPPPVKDQAAGVNLWTSFTTDPQDWWFPLVLPHRFPPWRFKSKFTEDKWNTRSSWLLAPESSFVWLSLDDQGLGVENARQITALAFRSMSK